MKLRSILAPVTAVLAATVVVLAGAQEQNGRAPFWPPITKSPVVNEWYSDLPWHQKLGTYAGNQIDQAIVMPYLALPQADRDFCKSHDMTNQDCMLEVGVTNVLGMQRIDTPYTGEGAIKDAPECKDATLPCIEVMLRVSNFYAKSGDNKISLARRVFGNGQATGPTGSLLRLHDLRRQHLCAADAVVHVALLRCHVYAAAEDLNDAGLLRRLPFDVQRRLQCLGVHEGGHTELATVGSVVGVAEAAVPGLNVCNEGVTVCNLVAAGFDLKPVPSAFTQ